MIAGSTDGWIPAEDESKTSLYLRLDQAGIAQLVEYDLPKVGVASSNLVSRSLFGKHLG